jgi:hypothetical protein
VLTIILLIAIIISLEQSEKKRDREFKLLMKKDRGEL